MLVLLDDGVFGLGQDLDQGVAVEGFQDYGYREAAHHFGDEAEFEEVVGGYVGGGAAGDGGGAAAAGEESQAGGAGAGAGFHHFVEAVKGAAADEQDVAGVDLQKFLVGVLAAALGGYVGGAAFDDFQQFLLDALAGYVAGDGGVGALFAGDFVHLVDVDDALFGAGDVPVGGLDQAEEDVFYILADVAGFG